jgi:heme exporter protein CcmD
MSLPPYAFFMVSSYLAAALVVALLVAWVALDHHEQKRRLRELEQSGVVRPSGRSATEP